MNKTAAVADELVGQPGLRYQDNVIFGKLVREDCGFRQQKKKEAWNPETVCVSAKGQKSSPHVSNYLSGTDENKQCLYFSVLTC